MKINNKHVESFRHKSLLICIIFIINILVAATEVNKLTKPFLALSAHRRQKFLIRCAYLFMVERVFFFPGYNDPDYTMDPASFHHQIFDLEGVNPNTSSKERSTPDTLVVDLCVLVVVN